MEDLIKKVCNIDAKIPLNPNNDNIIASTNNALTRIIINVEDDKDNFSLIQDFRFNRVIGRVVYKDSIGYPHCFLEGIKEIEIFFNDRPKLKEEFIYKIEEYLLKVI